MTNWSGIRIDTSSPPCADPENAISTLPVRSVVNTLATNGRSPPSVILEG